MSTDRLFVTRHTAQRAARRALGTDSAVEGVHFTTAKIPEGWTWTGIPGEALDALSEQVRRDAMLGRHERAPTADEAGVPNFLRNDFKGLEAMNTTPTETLEDGRPVVETPEAATKARKPAKGRTVEKTGAKKKPAKAPGKKEAALRALREKAATTAKGRDVTTEAHAVLRGGGQIGRKPARAKAAQEAATAPEPTPAPDAATEAPKPTRAKRAAKPAPAGEAKVNKTAIVGTMLARPEGATLAELLAATGWPAMSVPRQAELAKLDLRKEKEAGKPTRYFGTPKASA